MDTVSRHHYKLNKLCSLYVISCRIFVLVFCFDIDLFNDMYLPTLVSAKWRGTLFHHPLAFSPKLTHHWSTDTSHRLSSRLEWPNQELHSSWWHKMQSTSKSSVSIQASWSKHNISAVVAAKDSAATVQLAHVSTLVILWRMRRMSLTC